MPIFQSGFYFSSIYNNYLFKVTEQDIPSFLYKKIKLHGLFKLDKKKYIEIQKSESFFIANKKLSVKNILRKIPSGENFTFTNSYFIDKNYKIWIKDNFYSSKTNYYEIYSNPVLDLPKDPFNDGSCIRYFKFDNTVVDEIINQIPSWTRGGASYANGKYKQCLYFSGDDQLLITNPNPNSSNAITISFWMYWTGNYNQMPVGFQRYDLYFISNSFGFNTANSDIYGCSASSLVNRWVYITAIFRQGEYGDIYINGEKQNLSYRNNNTINPSKANIKNVDLHISGWGGDSGYNFQGYIDEFRIFNRELTSNEIKYLYIKNLEPYNESDAKRVFYFFDDFDNSSNWNIENSNNASITNSKLQITNTNVRATLNVTLNNNHIIETKFKANSIPSNGIMVNGIYNNENNCFGLLILPSNSNTYSCRLNNSWDSNYTWNYSFTDWTLSSVYLGEDNIIKIRKYGDITTPHIRNYSNYNFIGKLTLGLRYDNQYSGENCNIEFDWIRVRKKYKNITISKLYDETGSFIIDGIEFRKKTIIKIENNDKTNYTSQEVGIPYLLINDSNIRIKRTRIIEKPNNYWTEEQKSIWIKTTLPRYSEKNITIYYDPIDINYILQPFNDNSCITFFIFNNNLIDSIGNASATWEGNNNFSNGRWKNAALFDTNNAVKTNIDISNNSFTISAFIKINQTKDNNFFVGNNNTATNNGIGIGWKNSSTFTISFYNNDVDISYSQITNTWQHVIVTFDKETKVSKLYINGKYIGGGTHNNYYENIIKYIGHRKINSGDGFNGCIEAFRVFNRSLNDYEISVLYKTDSLDYNDGEEVFDFFDDFRKSYVDRSKWTYLASSYYVKDSVYHGHGGSYNLFAYGEESGGVLPSYKKWFLKVKEYSSSGNCRYGCMYLDMYINSGLYYIFYNGSNDHWTRNASCGRNSALANLPVYNWHTITILYDGNTSKFYFNDSLRCTCNVNLEKIPYLRLYTCCNSYYDYVLIGKYNFDKIIVDYEEEETGNFIIENNTYSKKRIIKVQNNSEYDLLNQQVEIDYSKFNNNLLKIFDVVETNICEEMNITISSGNIVNNIQNGEQIYTDKVYQITSLSSCLAGKKYIKKSYNGNYTITYNGYNLSSIFVSIDGRDDTSVYLQNGFEINNSLSLNTTNNESGSNPRKILHKTLYPNETITIHDQGYGSGIVVISCSC